MANIYTRYRPRVMHGKCLECLNEAEYYAAKQAGQKLPFIGYEYTLNWSHLAEVKMLEAALQSSFVFQPSRRPFHSDSSSLQVLPGSFTVPLVISIYYITESTEQEAIIDFIHNFFNNSDFPQCKIYFYEAERWHEETRSNSRTYQYLEGVLLREIVVS
ncbi:hypothetical protein [Hymenobacter arcticus]